MKTVVLYCQRQYVMWLNEHLILSEKKLERKDKKETRHDEHIANMSIPILGIAHCTKF